MAVCYNVGETEDGGVVRDKQQILSDNRHPHPEKHKVEKKGMRLRLSSLKSDPAGEERGEHHAVCHVRVHVHVYVHVHANTRTSTQYLFSVLIVPAQTQQNVLYMMCIIIYMYGWMGVQ